MKEKMAEKVLRAYLDIYTYKYELTLKHMCNEGCRFEVKEFCPDGSVQNSYSMMVTEKYRIMQGVATDALEARRAMLEPESFDERGDLEKIERLSAKAWFMDTMERYAKDTLELLDAYDVVCNADDGFPDTFAEEYPLDRSFEEILNDVLSWKEHQLKKIKEEMEA